ncbi:type II toxin-antitoxin system HicA family toxin [Candidatus Saccharibacteria bacterium]|nr:type II toxin-antitoxin system HicA family toxin [Candidatus Saccharibacteria bacterium]
MSVLRELNKSVSEVNSNLEKQVIRQGVEIPTPDSLVTFLIGQGFEVANQEGSHLKLTRLGKDGIRRTSVIPLHNKRLPLGTFKGILEQSGMTYGEYALATKRGRGKGPKPRLPWLPTTITPETDDKQS